MFRPNNFIPENLTCLFCCSFVKVTKIDLEYLFKLQMQGFLGRVFMLERFLFKLGRKLRNLKIYTFKSSSRTKMYTRMFEAHLHTTNN